MPYEIKFENTPAGVAVEAVRGPGMVKVQVLGFYSEEDGEKLIQQLEGFPSEILGLIPATPPIQPRDVRCLLAIIRRDATATVYINDLEVRGWVQPKRDFKAGDPVFSDDIADVRRLEFDGVTIPKDAGVLFVFAVGWRRGLFYDFIPLAKTNPTDRDYDIGFALGQFYSYLMFQNRFKIKEQEWKALLDGQWFSFVSLKGDTIHKLISHAANGWSLDDLTDAVADEVRDIASRFLARWKTAASFNDHMPILEKALNHYMTNDFLSAATMLYPRIEGLLRSHQRHTDPAAAASQKGLSGSATKKAETERHGSTPLLPSKFREYLETVYFAAFNPNDPKIKVNRNSVGHVLHPRKSSPSRRQRSRC